MASHAIVLTAGEESIYQVYLAKTGTTDAAVLAGLKSVLTNQVVQTINEAGHAKFNALSVADKITFIE
jgi:hypothetical protein